MPALFVENLAACVEPPKNLFYEAKVLDPDGTSPICDIIVAGYVLAGVYDTARRHLTVPCSASSKLSDQPESVSALVCRSVGVGVSPEYIALLAAENGATIILPREGALNASEVRIRPRLPDNGSSGVAGNSVVIARGADPYTALLNAVQLLVDHTGAHHKDVHAYALPLLDGASCLRLDESAMSLKSSGKVSSSVSLKAALEQQLHEGILVQAAPGCPTKPLLQAPGLRVCQGTLASLGLRYSGMSVVYGTATGHILAVMETRAALKMAPVGMLHSLGHNAVAGRPSSDTDSPSAVSAGASVTTSATPSPVLSRANSSNGDAAAVDASTSLAPSSPVSITRSNPLVLSGRSITTAPVIQVLGAASIDIAAPSHDGVAVPFTSTGVPAHVLASFALLGFRTAGGRVGAVRCCRIMPASAALSATMASNEATVPVVHTGLGLVVRVEVSSPSSGTLLLYVEGPDVHPCADQTQDELYLEVTAAQPVRRVLLKGQNAFWRYDGTGCILSVELPSAPEAYREVEIFL
ncbi:hypothetical protein VaNZ11_012852 [Volvox africanus]|uniref:Uncharacterized protein n=1 Tax=Volvox africanus TaxID=51714 RepID=A0ABQ5SGX1_9CHLO|nr:hypothetical protein VaNZ11_012852 [Volvox africanus]